MSSSLSLCHLYKSMNPVLYCGSPFLAGMTEIMLKANDFKCQRQGLFMVFAPGIDLKGLI